LQVNFPCFDWFFERGCCRRAWQVRMKRMRTRSRKVQKLVWTVGGSLSDANIMHAVFVSATFMQNAVLLLLLAPLCSVLIKNRGRKRQGVRIWSLSDDVISWTYRELYRIISLYSGLQGLWTDTCAINNHQLHCTLHPLLGWPRELYFCIFLISTPVLNID